MQLVAAANLVVGRLLGGVRQHVVPIDPILKVRFASIFVDGGRDAATTESRLESEECVLR